MKMNTRVARVGNAKNGATKVATVDNAKKGAKEEREIAGRNHGQQETAAGTTTETASQKVVHKTTQKTTVVHKTTQKTTDTKTNESEALKRSSSNRKSEDRYGFFAAPHFSLLLTYDDQLRDERGQVQREEMKGV